VVLVDCVQEVEAVTVSMEEEEETKKSLITHDVHRPTAQESSSGSKVG
jgi:hypothetical protein